MKFLKIKLTLFVAFLLSSSLVICSNIFILNKVKPEEGASIYVKVSYFPFWSPLIPITKSRELRYNETLSLVGINRIRWIRIRNAKKEWEKFRMPGQRPGGTRSRAVRKIKSRIDSLLGDERIKKACKDYLAENPDLKKKRKNPMFYCFPGWFRETGSRLENKAIVLGQFLEGLAFPVALAVTRKPGTGDFIVTEIAAGTNLLDMFGRGKFYHYIQGKDLDVYKKRGAQK